MLEKLKDIPQRETSGSDTFKNYDYQYHWAIYTLLENSTKNEDIAILVEFHEDVILVEDLSADNKLHFYQIKANDKHLTLNDITNRENGKKSILDKLSLNDNFLDLLGSIKSIKLISANGFNFCSNEVSFNQLKDVHKAKLESLLTSGIDKDIFLSKLYFSKSKLTKENFVQTVKGMLSEVIQEFYPDRKTNVNSIYLVLKNDIHDKGQRKLLLGEDPLQEKGMRFSSVKEVIERYTDINNDDLISAQEVLSGLPYPSLQKQIIKKELEKYSTHHINAGSIQAKIKLDILNSDLLQRLICCNNDKQLVKIVDEFCMNLSLKYGTITINEIIKSGVFYELSRYIREKT